MTGPQGDPPLHDLDPTRRFTDRAADYVRFRPDYPAAAIDCILAGLAPGAREPGALPSRELVAADVGAGTGISARQLAGRGVRVVAVEPNAAMRAAAAPHPLVAWREGTAEATGLAAGAVDLVLCAQAVHWVRQPEAIAEFHRVLRDGGRLALMWNARDRNDPFTQGYTEAVRAVNGDHPAERRALDAGVVHATGRFTPAARHEFPHAQRLDRAGLLGRATSASYVPKAGPALEELSRRLDGLFDRHRDAVGLVTLRYRTEVWIAARVGVRAGAPAPGS